MWTLLQLHQQLLLILLHTAVIRVLLPVVALLGLPFVASVCILSLFVQHLTPSRS